MNHEMGATRHIYIYIYICICIYIYIHLSLSLSSFSLSFHHLHEIIWTINFCMPPLERFGPASVVHAARRGSKQTLLTRAVQSLRKLHSLMGAARFIGFSSRSRLLRLEGGHFLKE